MPGQKTMEPSTPQAEPISPGRTRESVLIRIALTLGWLLFMAVVVAELKSAYEGRLVFASIIMLGPLFLVAAAQGFVLRGWPRRIASWGLGLVFMVLGFAALALFMIAHPRYYPIFSWWVLVTALWGLGTVWWRLGMGAGIVAWCLFPLVMIGMLATRDDVWRGRIERIPGGNIAMAETMVWLGEDPDIFAVMGMSLPNFGTPQDQVVIVGTGEEVALDDGNHTWELVPQQGGAGAILASVDYDAGTSKSVIEFRFIDSLGAVGEKEVIETHWFATADELTLVETGGPWRVLPRFVQEGDSPSGEFGATFLHRDSGRMIHVKDCEIGDVFATDDPERFLTIDTDFRFERDGGTTYEDIVLLEIDLTGDARPRTLKKHDSGMETLDVLAAHPQSGVFYESLDMKAGWSGRVHSSIEHLDMETGNRRTIARNVAHDDIHFVRHDGGVLAIWFDGDAWTRTLKADDGRAVVATLPMHPADLVRDTAMSPDGKRLAVVAGRGFLPGMIAQLYSSQVLFIWDLESGSVTELDAQPIGNSLLGFVPTMAGDQTSRLRWSRDGRRLAHFTTNMRTYSSFNTWNGGVNVYHLEGAGEAGDETADE
jgi:hypothetical protein